MADVRLFFLRRYVRLLNAYERWRDRRQIAQQLGWSEAEAEAMAEIYVDEEAALTGER